MPMWHGLLRIQSHGSLKSRLQGKESTICMCTLRRGQATGLKAKSAGKASVTHFVPGHRRWDTPDVPLPQTPLGTWGHWHCLHLTPTLQTSPPHLWRRCELSVDKAILILCCHSNFMLPSSSETYYPTRKVWETPSQGPQQVIQPFRCSHATCKWKHVPTTHILQNVEIAFRFTLYKDSSTYRQQIPRLHYCDGETHVAKTAFRDILRAGSFNREKELKAFTS